MVRDLKSPMQDDVKGVFLNMNDFASPEVIRYYRYGRDEPPDEYHIPAIVESDTNMNSVWNKNKAQQRAGNEPILFQMEYIMWVAQEDFQPPPAKNRKIVVKGKEYQILSVDTQDGLFQIELRILEE